MARTAGRIFEVTPCEARLAWARASGNAIQDIADSPISSPATTIALEAPIRSVASVARSGVEAKHQASPVIVGWMNSRSRAVGSPP